MRQSIILLFILTLFVTPILQAQPGKFKKIQKIIDEATGEKLPGVAVYIKTPKDGEWIGTAGFANVENKIALQKDDIFSLGSIGKMYNAVAVLKLAEDGYFKLDDKISKYLPAEFISNLPNAQLISIRNLLAHQTGLYNYEHDPTLNEQYLSGHLKLDTLTHLDALKRYVFGKPSLFIPGTRYDYSSTNYMLLAIIVDSLLPQGHAEYLRKNILAKAGFTNTYYRQTPPGKLVAHYGDLNQDGQIENVTAQTIETTNWFIGDDGIYAPIAEAAHFLQSLAQGKIIGKEIFKEMTTWDNVKHPNYGLGLMADKSFPYKFLYGHSGRGIGTTTDLYYFPKQDITVAIFCNMGLRASSPVFKKAYLKMRAKIIKRLFLF